jgi:hypothetical protein
LRRFLNALTLFLHFCNYLPLEDDLNKHEFPSPRMICAKSGKNRFCGSGEVKNLKDKQTDEQMTDNFQLR